MKKKFNETGEKLFIEALKDIHKKIGDDAVVLNILIDGKQKEIRLLSAVDFEGNMLFDGEKYVKKEKPSYLG